MRTNLFAFQYCFGLIKNGKRDAKQHATVTPGSAGGPPPPYASAPGPPGPPGPPGSPSPPGLPGHPSTAVARRNRNVLSVPLQLQGLEADIQVNIAKLFPGKPMRRIPFKTAFARAHATKFAKTKLELASAHPDKASLHRAALKKLMDAATAEENQAATDLQALSIAAGKGDDP